MAYSQQSTKPDSPVQHYVYSMNACTNNKMQ